MSDFEIRIKTTADLAAAKRLETALKDQVKVTKELGQDSTAVEAKLKAVESAMKGEAAQAVRAAAAIQKVADAEKGLASVSQEAASRPVETAPAASPAQSPPDAEGLGEMVNTAGTLGGVITKLGFQIVGITSGIAALANGIRSIGVAAVEAEDAQAGLDVALAQRGQLTEEYRTRLADLATQLEATTNIADEEWLGVLKRLAQSGSDPNSIGLDVEAVKNLAGLMGGDLQSAAAAVAKALGGNFEQFSRLGIQIDQNASQAEKLNKVYQELALRGGGQLEAMTKTLGGEWKNLKLQVSNLAEAIGLQTSKTGMLQRVTADAAGIFEFWAGVLGTVPSKLAGLQNASKRTTTSLEEGGIAAQKYAEHLGKMNKAAEQTGKLFNAIKDRITAASRAATELIDMDLAEELANIDILEKAGDRKQRGGVSGAEATLMRAAAERRAKQRKLEVEDAASRDIENVEVANIQQAESQVSTLQAQLADTKALRTQVEAAEEARRKVDAAQRAFDRQMEGIPFEGRSEVEGFSRAEALQAKINRAQEELLRSRAAIPKGVSTSDLLAGRETALSQQIKEAEKRAQDAREASEPVIEHSRAERAQRQTLTQRQIRIEERTATTRAADQVQEESRAGVEGVKTHTAISARLQRENNRLLAEAFNALIPGMENMNRTLLGITNRVHRMEKVSDWHKAGRTR